jgi:putative zinc finger/helix-turn-helix YgiT family protein
MKDICPICEKTTEIEVIKKDDIISVKGDPIKVKVDYYKCTECGGEFEDSRLLERPLEAAYIEYRRKHCLLQPEEILSFRKKLGLNQNELGDLLGWGAATLSRYENGAIQDKAYDNELRLAMEPSNLLKLINGSENKIPINKKLHLIESLQAELKIIESIEKLFEEKYGGYEPDAFSGYSKLSLGKLFNAIAYFCTEGVFKSKLNKLLFYLDFKHFKEFTVSVTGIRYAHVPYGPVPDKYSLIFAMAIENEIIKPEEVVFSNKESGEKYTTEKKADLTIYSESELETLVLVKKHFRDFTSKKIHAFSSKEKGYKETSNGGLISFDYAEFLQI